MNDWIHTLFLAIPKRIVEKIPLESIEKIPKFILKYNLEQLMAARNIKNSFALSQIISDKGLSLSKAQILRIMKAECDSSGSSLIKLAVGLDLQSEDYFYLYSPQGFDAQGKPIAKYADIDHDILVDCAQDAYTVLSIKKGEIDIEQFIKNAVSSYRTISRRKKDVY